MKYLIVGLGNIGAEYELTRHNVGFLVADHIADKFGATFETDRYAYKAKVKFKGRSIHLIKPTTYMNLSGKAVNYWLQELKVPIDNILVITDDIALPFGKLRMRAKGSSAGHNGLGNIEHTLKSSTYPRLRFGIGDNFYKGKQVDYVLSRFASEELDQLPEIIEKASDAAMAFVTIGISRAMNQYNS
ncbi:MAG TPA: aminoacyl-tRNA hydrolase [Cytophagales bacterium]|jgi:PTH1 family peptidyl-tRNA hydrolase|nr:aminoacyl-tRNA hydrolase [Cytophagales bacterium]